MRAAPLRRPPSDPGDAVMDAPVTIATTLRDPRTRTASGVSLPDRRFRALCVAVPLVAALSLHVQLPDAMGAHAALTRDYAAMIAGLASITLLLYLALVKTSSPRLRRLPFGRVWGRWHPVYVRSLPQGDAVFALAAMAATLPTFQLYKSALVGSDGYTLDGLFVQWDRALFLGHDPWRVTHAILPGGEWTRAIDVLYHPLFLPMFALFVIFAIARGRPALRRTYMATYLLSWVVIGMWMAQALPSAGPVFEGALWGDGAIFGPLHDRLGAQAGDMGGLYALAGRDYLLALDRSGTVGIGAGISAMPSMHVALALMWAMVGWSVSRGLGIALSVYAAVIWVGSIHLGWHYAVDGLVALVAVLAIWLGCGRLLGLYGPLRSPRG